MAIAAIWGTSVGYTEHGNHVTVETIDGRIVVISKNTFDYLYCRMDEFTAALKENCIEYVEHRYDKPILSYPEWYIQAVRDDWIVHEYGGYTFYDVIHGEIPMSPESIILRNHIGELRYMEPNEFSKYYDTGTD